MLQNNSIKTIIKLALQTIGVRSLQSQVSDRGVLVEDLLLDFSLQEASNLGPLLADLASQAPPLRLPLVLKEEEPCR